MRATCPGTDERRREDEVLEQENRELKRANEILKRAASSFGAALDRQQEVAAFIDAKRDDTVAGRLLGVQLIAACCRWPQQLLRDPEPPTVGPIPAGRGDGTGGPPAV